MTEETCVGTLVAAGSNSLPMLAADIRAAHAEAA
jgi:hypothetical protein